MSPHPALNNDDVLAEIFSHLSPITSPRDIERRQRYYWGPIERTRELELKYGTMIDGGYRHGAVSVEERRTLANAALTCKAFSELATAHLWAAPRGGLYTLLGLFATFTAQEHSGSFVDALGNTHDFSILVHYLPGDITDEEWATFVKCAGRVREFAFHKLCDHTAQTYAIDRSATDMIVRRGAGQLLFPQLRALMWQRSTLDGNGAAADHFLPLLSSPQISTLMLMSYPTWELPDSEDLYRIHCPPRNGIPQDAETIVSACPNIEHIIIHLCFESDTAVRLAQCLRLRSFVSHWVDSCTLESLGKLPLLRKIRTSVGPFPIILNATSITPPVPPLAKNTGGLFPVLRELQLDQSSAMYAKMMILSISSPFLSSISIELREVDPLRVHHFFAALPTVAASLRSLKVRLPYGVPYDPADLLVFEIVAAPLFELHNLEHLRLDMDERNIAVTDDDLQRMAIAWPRITSLYIATDSAYAHVAAHFGLAEAPLVAVDRPSVHALVALVRQSPHLVTCVIHTRAVTEADLQKLEQDTAGAAVQPQVLQLALAGFRLQAALNLSPPAVSVHDPKRLTSVLCRLFPNLDRSRVMAGKCNNVEDLQEEAKRRLRSLAGMKEMSESIKGLMKVLASF